MQPVLLVLNVQREHFAPEGGVILPDGEAALARIHDLIAAARGCDVPVIFLRHERAALTAEHFRRGAGARLHPSIRPRRGEPVVVKRLPGAFAGTGLGEHVARMGFDTAIVCGFMAHRCGVETARSAHARGLRVLFAADATASRDLTHGDRVIPHGAVTAAALALIAAYGEVLPVAEIGERLRRDAAARDGGRSETRVNKEVPA